MKKLKWLLIVALMLCPWLAIPAFAANLGGTATWATVPQWPDVFLVDGTSNLFLVNGTDKLCLASSISC